MAHIFGSIWDRFNRNALNNMSKSVEQQGKSIQDLVAKGQLTPTQYANLIQTVNGFVSKGEVSFEDIDINKGKLLPKHLSEEVLKMLTGDAPINAVPADRSITEEKYALNSVSLPTLSDSIYKNLKSPVLKVDVPNAILNGEVYSKILRGFYDSNFKVSNALEFDEIIIESISSGDPIGSPTISLAALKGDTVTTIVPKMLMYSIEPGGNMKFAVLSSHKYISGHFIVERDVYLDIYNGRLTYSNSTPSNILKLNKKTIEVERPTLKSNNDLSDYKAALLGSSSMDSRYERKTFMDWISERTGLQLLHYARGASSTTSTIEDWQNENATYTSGLQKTKELIDDNPELDLILCQPLISDEGRPLGEWESTSATTCYGAMHLIAKMILETYPGKPFGLITGQYIAGNNKARESLRHQCIKEIGHYYGIPVLDLRGEGLTPYVLDSFKDVYVPDGTHLNDEGAKIASRRVEAFVNMLMTGYEK